jgi:hypothetical protein
MRNATGLLAKAAWLDETIIELIISEAQNEVADFKKWGFDIIPTVQKSDDFCKYYNFFMQPGTPGCP